TAGRERMTLDTQGNIRVTTPGALNAGLRLNSNLGQAVAGDFTGLDFRFDRAGFGPDMGFAGIRAIRRDVGFGDNGTDLAFYTGVGGVDAFATERMRVTKTGSVGIGTQSPAA